MKRCKKQLDWVESAVKDHDMYGYSIPLNFNKQGDVHTTFFGGCMSVLVKIVIGLYIYLKVRKMIDYNDDAISGASVKLDLSKAG